MHRRADKTQKGPHPPEVVEASGHLCAGTPEGLDTNAADLKRAPIVAPHACCEPHRRGPETPMVQLATRIASRRFRIPASGALRTIGHPSASPPVQAPALNWERPPFVSAFKPQNSIRRRCSLPHSDHGGPPGHRSSSSFRQSLSDSTTTGGQDPARLRRAALVRAVVSPIKRAQADALDDGPPTDLADLAAAFDPH